MDENTAQPEQSESAGSKERSQDELAGHPSATVGFGGTQPPSIAIDEGSDAEDDPRRIAHEILGQAHAVLSIAAEEQVLKIWSLAEYRDDFVETQGQINETIGRAHALVASGAIDKELSRQGIGGALGRLKRRLSRGALERLSRELRDGTNALVDDRHKGIRAWLRAAVGAVKTPIDSFIQEIPGGHIIKEALEGVLAGLDMVDAAAATDPPPTPTTNVVI